MPQNIFTGLVAQGYDAGSANMYDPAVLEPTVRFLADVAAGDAALEFGIGHYFIERDRIARFDSPYRYVWPSELDLMAQVAGLDLRERWADWGRSRFTSESWKHVSVYQSPA